MVRDPQWRRCFIRPSSTARPSGTARWSSRARPSSPFRAATVRAAQRLCTGADNTSCRAAQGRTGCASRTRRGTTSCATRSSARTLGKLARCRWHLLHSSKDASDIIAGRFPKYGVLPNVYGSPATWNADLTIVSSMNMALHVGAEVTLRTLGTCPLYRRLMAHSSGLVAGCAGELPDARDAVRAPNPGAA